jgi:hypothetical protein
MGQLVSSCIYPTRFAETGGLERILDELPPG